MDRWIDGEASPAAAPLTLCSNVAFSLLPLFHALSHTTISCCNKATVALNPFIHRSRGDGNEAAPPLHALSPLPHTWDVGTTWRTEDRQRNAATRKVTPMCKQHIPQCERHTADVSELTGEMRLNILQLATNINTSVNMHLLICINEIKLW